jgi:tRNA G18 (ribose-2'-O)-methylase SpoU
MCLWGAVAWDVRSGPAAPPGWQTGQVAGPSEVRDPADPRLADYVSLTDSSLRTSLEARHGLFVAEGEKVIRRALAAGYGLRSLLVTAGRLARLTDLADECAAPVYVVTDEVAQQLTGYRVHRGALASMARRELPPVAGVLATARRVVVLEDLVDHGNVGAIFRCAAAFGAGAVILSPRCADPLYRRAVKVSMGAVFAVPYARMTDWYGGLAQLRTAGFRLLALTPDQSATPIGAALAASHGAARAGAGQEPGGRVALLLGGEGDGLSSRWLHEADQAVCIPMSPAAMALGVDSLNVVAAAAVACHALTAPAPSATCP